MKRTAWLLIFFALEAEALALTSDEVAKRAVAQSPEVASRLAQIQAAAAELDRTIALYLPRVEGVASYARVSPVPAVGGAEVPQNQYRFQATVAAPLSDYALRIHPLHTAARERIKGAELEELASERSIALHGRLTYYSWARSTLQIDVAARALEQAQQHLTDVKNALDAGTASQADLLRVEAQVASSEQFLVEAKNLRDLLEEELRTLMRDASTASYELSEDLSSRADFTLPEEPLLGALMRRPELRAVDALSEAIDSEGAAAFAGHLPRLEAFFDVGANNPDQRRFPLTDEFHSSWSAGARLVWTISDLVSAPATIDAYEAQLASLAAERRSLENSIRLEISEAKEALENARSGIETAARQLAAAEEGERVRRELFRAGRATSTELTDSETELTRARLAALDARIDLRVARARLIHALGDQN